MASSFNNPEIDIAQHISSNHIDMCRFAGPGDVEYAKVINALNHVTAARDFVCMPDRSVQANSLSSTRLSSAHENYDPTIGTPVHDDGIPAVEVSENGRCSNERKSISERKSDLSAQETKACDTK